MIADLKSAMPGVALCVAVTAVAKLIEQAEVGYAGHPYLEGLVVAILLGVLIRAFWTPGPVWKPGIAFSAKTLLEIAVVLLGASLSAALIVALGPFLLVGIAIIVAVAIVTSYGICRALGLPKKMSVLVACGNSICGNSAIAAVAPVIGARPDDVASSIAFTAVLGVVVVLGLPLLVPVLDLSLTQYGTLAGLTVYAVPQVLAATLPIGELSNQVGTVVKLVRVLMLGPVVLALAAGGGADAQQFRHRRAALAAADRTGAVVHRRISVAHARALARLHSAGSVAAAADGRRGADHDRDGGARPRRRRARGGESGPARRERRHAVARRARADQLRADPACGCAVGRVTR